MACQAVMKTTGSVAASSKERLAGNGAEITGSSEGLGGEAEGGEAEDAVAGGEVVNAGADFANDAADFVAEDGGVGGFARVEREGLENVAEVHSGGDGFDEDFAGAGCGKSEGRELEGIEVSTFLRLKSERNRGRRDGGDLGLAVAEAAGVAGVAAEGDFALGEFGEELGEQ